MDLTTKVLETWGPAGIIIAALSYATVALWKRNSTIQDKRIEEANERAKDLGNLVKEGAVAMAEMGAALNSLRDVIMRPDR